MALPQNDRSWHDSPTLINTVLPISAIVLLVVALWLPFGFKTTGLVEEWDVLGLLAQGYSLWFIDASSVMSAHAIRPFEVLPHAIAYTLDPNSFLWFNLQQMLFFIGKGVFAFLLVRRLLPRHDLLAFTTAVLFIIYPADTGLFTFRAIHIHAAVMFYFAAVYYLLVHWDHPRWWSLLLMWGTLLMSLLLYEIAFPLAALTPALLLFRTRKLTRRVIGISAVWYLMPLIAGLRIVSILFSVPSNALYQTSVISANWSNVGLLEAVAHTYTRSFARAWMETLETLQLTGFQLVLTVAIVAVVLVISLLLARIWRAAARARWSDYALVIIFSLLFMLVGFAPYLLSAAHRMLTLRTFYLPSFGAAVVLLTLLFVVLRSKAIFAITASAFICLSTVHAFQQADYYHRLSQREQRFLGELIEIAPALHSETSVIVLDRTGLLQDEWFFASGEGLSLALTYVYHMPTLGPAVICSGSTSHMTSVSGEQCSFGRDSFSRIDADGNTTQTIPYHQMFVLEYGYDDELRLVYDLNPYTSEVSPITYDPHIHIDDAAAAPTSFFECWPIENCTLPIRSRVLQVEEHLVLDAASLIGVGWRGVEIASGGVSFRWITNTSAHLPISLDQTRRYQISVHIVNWLTTDAIASVRLALNGTEIPSTTSAGGTLITGDIAPGLADREIDEIEVRVPHLDTVPGTNIQLGVAVDSLSITPLGNAG